MNQTGDKVENDGFLKLETMKFPVFAARSFVTIEKCRELCLNNCSCIAYAYDAGIGCMTWTGSLIDLQKFSIGGADLYIRLAHSELEKKDNKVVVIVPVVAGTITCAICIFFVCKWMTKRKAYAYDAGLSCMTWAGSLIDIQKFSSEGGDLYIRLAHSELEKRNTKVLIIVPVLGGIITIAICAFFLQRWMSKRNGNMLISTGFLN
ncbi:hypothetical protein Q3G72_029964 [Acer saccharum]|nr:hypothetical protein Q3G72_029964 [Acer saccharum]